MQYKRPVNGVIFSEVEELGQARAILAITPVTKDCGSGQAQVYCFLQDSMRLRVHTEERPVILSYRNARKYWFNRFCSQMLELQGHGAPQVYDEVEEVMVGVERSL